MAPYQGGGREAPPSPPQAAKVGAHGPRPAPVRRAAPDSIPDFPHSRGLLRRSLNNLKKFEKVRQFKVMGYLKSVLGIASSSSSLAMSAHSAHLAP
mmetsp:Transcript_14039/g.48707  ORF Transcript_14039/g.48707 Transcript_14039/m.48707 type:complete len:96 (-) Transcript_14039:1030-1317(-)